MVGIVGDLAEVVFLVVVAVVEGEVFVLVVGVDGVDHLLVAGGWVVVVGDGAVDEEGFGKLIENIVCVN